MRIDPQRLIRLGELMRQGSFKRAADSLGITQPALSQSIAQMEAEVGVRLIDRTPHGVVPTVYGQALLEHSRSVERQLADAAQKIAELAFGHQGTLAIGGTSGGAITILSRAICRLREDVPDIDTRIVEETWSRGLLARLDDRTLDVIICHRPDDLEMDSKVALPLFRARRALCVRAGHPMADNLVLSELAGYPFACPGGEMGIQHDVRRIFKAMQIDFPTHQVVTSNSLAAAKEVVFNSDAFAIFSDLSVLHEERQGSLKLAPISNLGTEYWYYMVAREDHVVSDLLMKFIAGLIAVCNELGIAMHPEMQRLREGRPFYRIAPEAAASAV